jgi:hypothetical protein
MNKITVLEYAKRKGVSKQAVQQQINKGKLEAEKIEGQWFINEEPTVDAGLGANRQAGLGANQQAGLGANQQAGLGANQQELLDQLRSENEYLRNKLDDSDGARVRSDTIIMQLTQQLERTQLQLDSLRETTTLWQRVKSIFLHKPA